MSWVENGSKGKDIKKALADELRSELSDTDRTINKWMEHIRDYVSDYKVPNGKVIFLDHNKKPIGKEWDCDKPLSEIPSGTGYIISNGNLTMQDIKFDGNVDVNVNGTLTGKNITVTRNLYAHANGDVDIALTPKITRGANWVSIVSNANVKVENCSHSHVDCRGDLTSDRESSFYSAHVFGNAQIGELLKYDGSMNGEMLAVGGIASVDNNHGRILTGYPSPREILSWEDRHRVIDSQKTR